MYMNSGMIDELERTWREAAAVWLRHFLGICLEELTKTSEIISQDSRDSNPIQQEYESRTVTAILTRSIIIISMTSLYNDNYQS
jgi:hypothetical protein